LLQLRNQLSNKKLGNSMDTLHFDVAVIGAGPGGYIAAIKASQLGKKVCLIEKGLLGGTCLNVGCIPTKTLISNAHALHLVKNAALYGINVSGFEVDYSKSVKRKDDVIDKIRRGLEGLIKANQIEIIHGQAEFISNFEIKVKGENPKMIKAQKVIIASGSEPMKLSSIEPDHKQIFNSTSILSMTKLPKSMAIIGGGYIGCEFAALFREYGVEVTIIEALDSIVQAQGKSVSEALTSAMNKRGVQLKLKQPLASYEKHHDHVVLKLADGSEVKSEIVLVSVGRSVYTEGLALDKTGIACGQRGEIIVDDHMETSVKGVYAIGDVTGKYMLAHVASHQGVVAAACAAGKPVKMHYNAVPAVIFTDPEIGTVGMTLEAALAQGIDAKVGKFPFQALGKSQAAMHTEGFAQIVIESKTGKILGAQIVGHEASNLIAEVALAIHNELTVESISDTIHAHPTLAEGLHEAALMAQDMPLHMPPKPKK
jgi:dihydrolipoamide dehydrogenase